MSRLRSVKSPHKYSSIIWMSLLKFMISLQQVKKYLASLDRVEFNLNFEEEEDYISFQP